ncbi:MAG: GNAT family N-acetyltransferase [Deltaproteobacteria bacterium]|nr:GNAT family N-acetyltransferase [Deltaproteobacteria bacterium]MBW2393068.1 GNAT family N-acetyltransferase [Deltaproteobacteria bacterium]
MPQDIRDFADLPAPGLARPDDLIEDLGDGLLLRRAREEDIEAIAAFQAVVQADPPDFERYEHIAQWVRQLMDGSHPSARARDFLLVHDTQRELVASSLCLLRHQFAYDGVEVAAGMPELVGTHPDHRHRKLVARQFAEVHRWSDEGGDWMQVIDGIPWYYRQFGYEMAAQRFGGRIVPHADLPKKPVAGLRVRAARPGDEKFIAEAFDHGMQRYRLTCQRDQAFWGFELDGRRAFTTQTRFFRIVETESGEPRAVFNHVPILIENGHTWTPFLEVAAGTSWKPPLMAALHDLREIGTELAVAGECEHAGAGLVLGTDHPAFDVLGHVGKQRRPYAWYIRVADLPGFLLHVAPALEARLAHSIFEGHDGTLSLSFYRTGVRLRFEKGRLMAATPWRPSTEEVGDAAFPDLSFLHLLFGHRSLGELENAFPDVQVKEAALVEALFPKQASFLMATS